MIWLLLLACRPEAPVGYYDHCSLDSGGGCEEGLTCLVTGTGEDWCTMTCSRSAECPPAGNGRPVSCVEGVCTERAPYE